MLTFLFEAAALAAALIQTPRGCRIDDEASFRNRFFQGRPKKPPAPWTSPMRMTGCSVAAIKMNGVMAINPDPQMPVPQGAELILIGTYEGEKSFLQWMEQ